MDCFLFDVGDNQLKITAADSETRMVTAIEISEVTGAGAFAIPSKNLLEALKELPEQPIRFEIDESTLALFIYYENGKYNFVAQKGDEYPQSKPLTDDAAKLTIDADALLSGITHTIFATGDEDLRPIMNGVFFDITPENLTFVGSDGHKLVRLKNLSVVDNVEASFILPKKPANLLKTILPRETGQVTIAFDANNAYITMEKFTVVCRLIEGKYPQYNAVIPTDNPYNLTADRLNFLNALKRVSTFSSGTNLIKLSLSPNSIFISAQDVDFSTSAEETITCMYDGAQMSIGFKGAFLIETLNNMLSEEVTLAIADPSRAGLLLPVENEENEDLLMLLMPMMLND
ncbi:DNA polymerase III subunit beta [Bacteroidia bacterium]|nr:DNA polymerase III subunit beta [Bacteroidia bacterium]